MVKLRTPGTNKVKVIIKIVNSTYIFIYSYKIHEVLQQKIEGFVGILDFFPKNFSEIKIFHMFFQNLFDLPKVFLIFEKFF